MATAKSAKSRKSQKHANESSKKIAGELIGVFALILAAFSLLALSTYVASDPILSWVEVSNRAGVAGAPPPPCSWWTRWGGSRGSTETRSGTSPRR